MTATQLRAAGLMSDTHAYAKSRNKWTIRAIGIAPRPLRFGISRKYVGVTIEGTPPQKNGKKRKRPISTILWRKLTD